MSDIIADSFDDLLVCSDKREGATAYVKDEKTAYICKNADWVVDGGESSSSSHVKDNASSSSRCEDCKDEATSSSSTDKTNYSSYVAQSDSEESSSSNVPEPAELSSSSSFDVQNCSALLEATAGWSWDIPKECRFNPNITYGTMTDDRDNKVYKTVKIGDQTWMAENLNYADSVKTPSLLERSWCYSNKAENCDVAGRLYTWAAAIDSVKLATDADNPQDCGYGKTCTLPAKVQGICPEGWHLPTNAEWSILFTNVGGQGFAGKILKSQTGWNNNGNGTDAYGFSALPAALRYDDVGFNFDGEHVFFWSASEYNSDVAYDMLLWYNDDANLSYNSKIGDISVRCLKD